MKKKYDKPGRPPMDDENRVPVNSLVKPATNSLLDAWGPSRGIRIDKLVEAEKERIDYNSQG